jgi:hypothetical protein
MSRTRDKTHSATRLAFLTTPTISTTKITATASFRCLLVSSRSLGCPGRSTSLTVLLRDDSSGSWMETVVDDARTDVCVCG